MLFLLFIYDEMISIINSNLLMYADDVKIYFSFKHQSHSSLQQEGMYAFSSVQSSRFCYPHNVELFTGLEILMDPK